ncbi:MAG: hypothetical protein Q9168_006510 [Polycauliona sp. 1 TL-2023]
MDTGSSPNNDSTHQPSPPTEIAPYEPSTPTQASEITSRDTGSSPNNGNAPEPSPPFARASEVPSEDIDNSTNSDTTGDIYQPSPLAEASEVEPGDTGSSANSQHAPQPSPPVQAPEIALRDAGSSTNSEHTRPASSSAQASEIALGDRGSSTKSENTRRPSPSTQASEIALGDEGSSTKSENPRRASPATQASEISPRGTGSKRPLSPSTQASASAPRRTRRKRNRNKTHQPDPSTQVVQPLDLDFETDLSSETYNQCAALWNSDSIPLKILSTFMVDELLPNLFLLLPAAPRLIQLGVATRSMMTRLLRVNGVKIQVLDNNCKHVEASRRLCEAMLDSLPAGRRPELPEHSYADFLSLREADSEWRTIDKPDAIISTFVLEHTPLRRFFTLCWKLLRPGGLLLCTNWHPAMGHVDQVLSADPVAGRLVAPSNYAYTIQEVLSCAVSCGFTELVPPLDRMVGASDLERLGDGAMDWLGINVWYGVILLKPIETEVQKSGKTVEAGVDHDHLLSVWVPGCLSS